MATATWTFDTDALDDVIAQAQRWKDGLESAGDYDAEEAVAAGERVLEQLDEFVTEVRRALNQ